MSGVEAAVNALRAFAESAESSLCVAEALVNVAQAAVGAVAIVSRGASRQISRMLQDFVVGAGASAQWGAAAPTVLERLLAVVDFASDVTDAADTLKKQGVVQVVVSLLDSSAVGDGAAAQQDTPDTDAFVEVRRLITSILSKLLNMADVGEACKAVSDTVTRVEVGLSDGPGGGVSKATLGVGVAGLNKLAALCEVAIGRNAGQAAWRDSCMYARGCACVLVLCVTSPCARA